MVQKKVVVRKGKGCTKTYKKKVEPAEWLVVFTIVLFPSGGVTLNSTSTDPCRDTGQGPDFDFRPTIFLVGRARPHPKCRVTPGPPARLVTCDDRNG